MTQDHLKMVRNIPESEGSLTDQLCELVDVLKGLVERREIGQALDGLEKLKGVLRLVQHRLDVKPDLSWQTDHAEVLALTAQYPELLVSKLVMDEEARLTLDGQQV